jgi:hypothetical protein
MSFKMVGSVGESVLWVSASAFLKLAFSETTLVWYILEENKDDAILQS